MPGAVADAVREYRSEMDVVGQFLEDRCIVREHAQVTAKFLYAAYRHWADKAGEAAVTQSRFGRALSERGFRKKKARTGVIRLGLELENPEVFYSDV